MKDEDVKADEKVEEENFQQDTTLPLDLCPCLSAHHSLSQRFMQSGHNTVILKSPSPLTDAMK